MRKNNNVIRNKLEATDVASFLKKKKNNKKKNVSK